MRRQLITCHLSRALGGLLCVIFVCTTKGYSQTEFQGFVIDTSEIVIRHIPDSSIQSYQADKALSYYLEPAELNFWDRFLLYIEQFFDNNRSGTSIVLKIFFYALAVLAVVGIAFLIIRVGPGSIWAKSKKFVDGPSLTEEELQDLDFESLIREAVNQENYKKGVRLLYLETLKKLTEREWIKWKPDKTNWEYVKELEGKEVYQDFRELTKHYEYVWYGDFPIDLQQFQFVENIFRHFQLGVEGLPV
ncbi:MAG: DUF4129 domain-containing protein [Bacteroidota bacterium]